MTELIVQYKWYFQNIILESIMFNMIEIFLGIWGRVFLDIDLNLKIIAFFISTLAFNKNELIVYVI